MTREEALQNAMAFIREAERGKTMDRVAMLTQVADSWTRIAALLPAAAPPASAKSFDAPPWTLFGWHPLTGSVPTRSMYLAARQRLGHLLDSGDPHLAVEGEALRAMIDTYEDAHGGQHIDESKIRDGSAT